MKEGVADNRLLVCPACRRELGTFIYCQPMVCMKSR